MTPLLKLQKMNNAGELKNIFEKYVNNLCTRKEIEDLLLLFDNPENETALKAIIIGQLELINAEKVGEGIDLDQKEALILSRLQPQLINTPAGRGRTVRLWPQIAAASVVFFVLGILLYLNLQGNKQNVILPGGNKASLTLSNGKIIILDDNKAGSVIRQGNINIDKTANGQLVYEVTAGKSNAADSGYNTIKTPVGGQYQVVLPDGSRVWLNATSSIRFPTSFSSSSRKVELIGEAYFEVAKIKNAAGRVPFIVQSNGQAIEVLGTHFNVNSYADEPFTKTTLLEGLVRVSAAKQQRVIKPGEQSRLKNGQLTVLAVNIDDEVAWRNGNFQFNDEDIKTVMRELSRWYNVDVLYKGKVTDETFGGTISRSKNISEVLKSLEETGAVHFKIEGRRITVMQ